MTFSSCLPQGNFCFSLIHWNSGYRKIITVFATIVQHQMGWYIFIYTVYILSLYDSMTCPWLGTNAKVNINWYKFRGIFQGII